MCSTDIHIEVKEIDEEVEREAIEIAIQTGEIVIVTVVPNSELSENDEDED